MAPRALYLSFAIRLTTVFATVFHHGARLEPASQLQKRNPYYGGFALVQGPNACPASTETCATGFCCPLGTYCSADTSQPYCCPTSEDCGTQVADLPTCADPSWVMFLDANYFCCPADKIGIVYGQCQSKALTFSAAQYASTATQANSLAPTGTAPIPSGVGTSSATTTTRAATTETTSSAAQTSAAGKGQGNHARGSEQAVLGAVVGLAAMVVPAVF